MRGCGMVGGGGGGGGVVVLCEGFVGKESWGGAFFLVTSDCHGFTL